MTYLVGRDYELAYETVLHVGTGTGLSINVALVGELNQQVVVRDALRRPKNVSGYAQGRVLVADKSGATLFRGRYYDSRIVQLLSGDDNHARRGASGRRSR